MQNVVLVGMVSEISKKHTYKFVDPSRHNRIKGAMTNCLQLYLISVHISLGPLDSIVT